MQNLYAQAVRFHRGGQFKQAESLYRQILGKTPNHPEALNAIGMLCLQTKRYDEARLWLGKAAVATNNAPQILLSLAEACRNMGKTQQVLEICQKLIQQNSHLPQAYFYLGTTHQDERRHEAAIDCYRKSLQLMPNFPECWNSLGVAWESLLNTQEAIQSFTEALKHAPRHLGARVNLGRALKRNGELYEAQVQYQRVIELGGGSARVYAELGDIWIELQDYGKAASNFKEALRLDPGYAKAYNGMGICEQMAGRRDAAEQNLEQSIKLNSLVVTPYFHLAHNKRASSINDPLIGRIKGRLQEGRVKGEQEAVLQFALAKLLDDCGEYEQASAVLQAANQTVFGKTDYSISQDQERFASIRRAFHKQMFERGMEPGSTSDQPVFIVGMPRSGTTLVEQIVSSHPAVSGAGELRLMSQVETRLGRRMQGGYPDAMDDVDHALLTAEATWYLEGVKLFSGKGEFARITDKMPHNFLRLGLIQLLFPNARIIHCRRDPLDNCLSLYFQMFGSNRHPYCYDLAALGQYFGLYQSLMQHWRDVLPQPILDVDYEELVAEPEAWARKLISFVGLEWNEACLSPQHQARTVKTASQWQVRQPIYRTSVNRWRNYAPFLEQLAHALDAKA